MASVVIVVADRPDALVTYLPEGAPFAFAEGHPLGAHPWQGRSAWHGHGVLMLQRPGESYAVWHFWDGAERDFAGWYLNIQEPFRRTTLGFDTMDLELDIWAPAEGGWSLKDDELLDVRVDQGRFTAAEAARIRDIGSEIGDLLDRDERWWGDWTSWAPEAHWVPSDPPANWLEATEVGPPGASRRARAGRAAAAGAGAPTSSTRRGAPSGSARAARG